MVTLPSTPKLHRFNRFIETLKQGGALLPDQPQNVLEVVGILKSYGIVLDAYSKNLVYIADHQFLELFPFFKYFNGEITTAKLLRHWFHDRINFEYAEYCMKTMQWHGGGGLDAFLDTPEFEELARTAIAAKIRPNFPMRGLHQAFPNFLLEQVRQQCFYSGLGQFWEVMSEMFLTLSDGYDAGTIQTIPQVVAHIRDGLVAAASNPITYSVTIAGQQYPILPASANLTFLADTAIPYVEAVFFRGTPFFGTVSYNAQTRFVPANQADFNYGALFADPLPIGGAGIPPTLLMQDMRHYLPEYLHAIYRQRLRGEDDLRVQICQSFQKSMFCVTSATILGLAPHPLDTQDAQEQQRNQVYLEGWMDKLTGSQLLEVNLPVV
jgi:CO2 hydration protein